MQNIWTHNQSIYSKTNKLVQIIYKKIHTKNIRLSTCTTKNNIFVTLHAAQTQKTITKSAGVIGIKNKKKRVIALRYLLKIFSMFLNTTNIRVASLFANKTSDTYKRKLLSNLSKTKLHLIYFYNLGVSAHGGTKLYKKRRL
jgi:hypothetical protein